VTGVVVADGDEQPEIVLGPWGSVAVVAGQALRAAVVDDVDRLVGVAAS
jgi:hypothetical protein